MSVIQGLEWTFDTVASTYEKMRPGYAPELYRMIFDYIPIGEHSHVAEVGTGAGQATLPILQTGCRLTAVEYGERFSELLQEKFKDYPKFSVITGKFEETELETGAFDLVFSATAFHWIPEQIGYEKVFSMLKSGGAFARFANHPHPAGGNPALAEEIDEIYDRYYNKFHNRTRKPIPPYTEAQAKELAEIAGKYGFTDLRHALFHRERVFSAEEYIALLGTYSDHIAIEASIRAKFFAAIKEAIGRHGGSISIYDTMDLQLARKP